MFTPLPMHIEFTSPRNTVPYQMLQPSPITTSPIIVAFSAKKVSFPIMGVKPLTDFINAMNYYVLSVIVNVLLIQKYAKRMN